LTRAARHTKPALLNSEHVLKVQPSRLETRGGAGGGVACGLCLRNDATASPVHHAGSMTRSVLPPSDDRDPPISMGSSDPPSSRMRGERPRHRERVGTLRGSQQCWWGLAIRPALAQAAPWWPPTPSRNPGRTSASQTARLPTRSPRGVDALPAMAPPPRLPTPKRSRLVSCGDPGAVPAPAELIPQASSPWPNPSQLRRRAADRISAAMCAVSDDGPPNVSGESPMCCGNALLLDDLELLTFQTLSLDFI